MVTPGSLWTAAHHKVPLLDDHAQQPGVASGDDAFAAHGQPPRTPTGTCEARNADRQSKHRLREERRGQWAFTARVRLRGREQLGPAIARALKVVKSGMPALVDVVAQATLRMTLMRAIRITLRIADSARTRRGVAIAVVAVNGALAQTARPPHAAVRRCDARQGHFHEVRVLRMPRYPGSGQLLCRAAHRAASAAVGESLLIFASPRASCPPTRPRFSRQRRRRYRRLSCFDPDGKSAAEIPLLNATTMKPK